MFQQQLSKDAVVSLPVVGVLTWLAEWFASSKASHRLDAVLVTAVVPAARFAICALTSLELDVVG